MSKRRLTKRQQKFLRYTVGVVLYPLSWIIGPMYKWYRKIRYKKDTEIKYGEIVKGFSYLVVPDSEVEKIAKQRAAICAGCPWAKFSGNVSTIVQDNKTVTIRGLICDVCGCSTSALVRSDKPCPTGKWR